MPLQHNDLVLQYEHIAHSTHGTGKHSSVSIRSFWAYCLQKCKDRNTTIVAIFPENEMVSTTFTQHCVDCNRLTSFPYSCQSCHLKSISFSYVFLTDSIRTSSVFYNCNMIIPFTFSFLLASTFFQTSDLSEDEFQSSCAENSYHIIYPQVKLQRQASLESGAFFLVFICYMYDKGCP